MLYAIKNKDGSVNLLSIVVDALTTMSEEEILAKDIPEGATYRKIDQRDLPKNRLFRPAWTYTPESSLDIDSGKAQVVHMARIREARNKKLLDLDKDTLKYIANPDELKKVEGHKQKLRDLPATVDISKLNLNRPEETWPKELDLPPEYKKSP